MPNSSKDRIVYRYNRGDVVRLRTRARAADGAMIAPGTLARIVRRRTGYVLYALDAKVVLLAVPELAVEGVPPGSLLECANAA